MELIGHARIHQALLRAQEKGALVHAYAFVGPAHVGKATMARLLVERLDPGYRRQMHPDVMIVERLADEDGKPAKSIKVDQVRGVCERLSQSAMAGGYKVALIEEAELLQGEAANALLKTLEEPKGQTVLFLCATSSERLPATILSRCQFVRFAPVPAAEIQTALIQSYGLPKQDAADFAALAMGRPGVAVSLVKDTLARSRAQTRVQAVLDLASRSTAGRLAAAATLGKQEDWQESLDAWEEMLRDVLLQKIGCEPLMVHQAQANVIREAAVRISSACAVRALAALREVRAALVHSVNPSLALEHILLNLS